MYFKIIVHDLKNAHSGFTVEHTSISSIKEQLNEIFRGRIALEESAIRHKVVLYAILFDREPDNNADLSETLTNPENQHALHSWGLSSLEGIEEPFLNFVEARSVFAGTNA